MSQSLLQADWQLGRLKVNFLLNMHSSIHFKVERKNAVVKQSCKLCLYARCNEEIV